MKKLLQINVTANWGSTGKIAEQIGLCAQKHGWESYIAYGRIKNPSQNRLIKIGGRWDVLIHYAENRIFDREGLSSTKPTRKLIQEIEKIKPDVIQLHNIHDHYLNYKLLFEHLDDKNIAVVWTQHDQWAITGHCYYDGGCSRWKTGCDDCPQKFKFSLDRSKRNFDLKKNVYSAVKDMTIVTVSEWLARCMKDSFFQDKRIQVIPNGIDINTYRYQVCLIRTKYRIETDKKILLGVAAVWNDRKGLYDYIRLASLLPAEYIIVLVGLTKRQISTLPSNVVGIERTNNQQELAQLYSAADILLSLSKGDTFGMTIAEAYACGTPCIVYDNTAQPEIVTPATGRVVRTGDIEGVFNAVIEMTKCNFKQQHSADCRKRAEGLYDKDRCFEKYIELYEELLLDK